MELKVVLKDFDQFGNFDEAKLELLAHCSHTILVCEIGCKKYCLQFVVFHSNFKHNKNNLSQYQLYITFSIAIKKSSDGPRVGTEPERTE